MWKFVYICVYEFICVCYLPTMEVLDHITFISGVLYIKGRVCSTFQCRLI